MIVGKMDVLFLSYDIIPIAQIHDLYGLSLHYRSFIVYMGFEQ